MSKKSRPHEPLNQLASPDTYYPHFARPKGLLLCHSTRQALARINDMEWIKVGRVCMEWSGVEWSRVEWSRVEWSGVDLIALEWSGEDCSGLE